MKTFIFISIILATIAGGVTGGMTSQLLYKKYKQSKASTNIPIQISGEKPNIQFLPPVDGITVVVIGVDEKKYLLAIRDGVGAMCEK